MALSSSSCIQSSSSSSSYPVGLYPPSDHPEADRLFRAVRLGYSSVDDKHLDFLTHLCAIGGVKRSKGKDLLRQIENVLFANDPNEYEEIDGRLHIYKNHRNFIYPTIGLWKEQDLSAFFGQVVQSLYPPVLESLKGREIKVIVYGFVLADGFGDLSHICTVFEIIKDRFPAWDISAICTIAQGEKRKHTVDLILQDRPYQPEVILLSDRVKLSETAEYQTMVKRLDEADVVVNVSYPFPIAGIDSKESTLKVFEYGCHREAPFTSMGVAPNQLGLLSYSIQRGGLHQLRCSKLRTFLLNCEDPQVNDAREYYKTADLVYGYVKDRLPKMSSGQKEYVISLSQKIQKCEHHILRLKKLRDAKHRGNRKNALSIQVQVHEERLRELQQEKEFELHNPDIPGFPWIEPFILTTCSAFAGSKKNLEMIVPFEDDAFNYASDRFFRKQGIRKIEFIKKGKQGDLEQVSSIAFPWSGKQLTVINPFPLCNKDVQMLATASVGIVGCIGDASLGQALSCKKLPFYAIYSFKGVFFFNFISYAKEILSSRYPLEKSFALIQYFNALFKLHNEEGDLIRKCERLGTLMRNRKLYEQLHFFLEDVFKNHSANRIILDAFSRIAAHAQHPQLKTMEEDLRVAFVDGKLSCVDAYEALKKGIESFSHIPFDRSD